MKERPILFSGPMIRAILAGKKTQTRRVIKPQPETKWVEWCIYNNGGSHSYYDADGYSTMHLNTARDYRDEGECPYGAPGDTLWVRETWACIFGVPKSDAPHPDDVVCYRADTGEAERIITEVKGWRPSIHMPRAYSRITLEVVSVRVERLQDITEEDAIAEGVSLPARTTTLYDGMYRDAFSFLWDDINGKRGYPWSSNCWVWVVSFLPTERRRAG